mmetsp:Transcript_10696/g.27021  ORF Transcript_10696/g.27021 Transcript_10696/m.27021 type:complete len:413 (+) Transcript_10696:272-1510(+)
MRRTSSSAGRMANPSASTAPPPSTGATSTSTSTTSTTASASSALPQPTVASVHFKARCETLGHGEDVYMVPLDNNETDNDDDDDDNGEKGNPPSPAHRHKMIPLYTTSQSYPWYSTLSSLAMPVVNMAMAMDSSGIGVATNTNTNTNTNSPGRQLFNAYRNPAPQQRKEFRYRYAVFRAGAFHRWESDEDENFCPTSNEEDPNTLVNTEVNAHHHDGSGGNNNNSSSSDTDSDTALAIKSDAMVLEDNNNNKKDYHVLPLRFLHPGETYIVNDVLGKRKGQKPDIYHKKTLHTGNHQYVGVEGSGTCPKNSSAALKATAAAAATPQISNSKKSVGFAVPPPARKQAFGNLEKTAFHNNNNNNNIQNGTNPASIESLGENNPSALSVNQSYYYRAASNAHHPTPASSLSLSLS